MTSNDPPAGPALDLSQVHHSPEKVVTVANTSNERVASTNGSKPVKVNASDQIKPNGEPRKRKPAQNNESPKSYAAAASADGEPVQDATPRSNKRLDEKEDEEYPTIKKGSTIRRGTSQTNEAEAWEAGGIRFAPVQVPLVRRLQTAAVLFHCMSIILFVSAFWFTCANPFAWPILIPYLIHLSTSTASTNGNLAYRSEWLRSLPLWTLFAGYFPAKLHKTHDLSPERKYIFGYHPHGIISHGAWLAFATNALGFADKFPGITNSLLTLDSNFRLPFYRDWLLLMGIRSVSKDSIWNTLSKGGPNNDGAGRAVSIVIGGARESLEAQPGTLRLILEGRKGFIKMALRTGSDLVPVLAFGENDLYDQLSPKTHPLVHKIQMFVLKVFKFTVPALHGRGVLNYDVGLMPYRRPVNIVVGKPIEVDRPHGNQPVQADIDRLHELYVEEIERIWNEYKDQFASGRTSELKLIS
ncbi:diacylglycerol acyltransferase-domain-containing protein [Emericellopsis atlantica]|uniref:Diacylglycerol O-acyltransferase n=1 Tax=Emericellopsis atlantica TaxID=2614577 RepID=A0A9P8CNV0_9HYPO|nr:diacylglycerol acyltransferase-domain-containing protein [Emericellopsis atlantica]KAG9253512.1 diacylglycerol acyltransferase-domain-containing protein [Emericellopsis atlantica]